MADGEPASRLSSIRSRNGVRVAEAAIGVAYATISYLLIRSAERLSLRHATLDRS